MSQSFFLGRTQEQDQFRRVLEQYVPLSWAQRQLPTLSRPFTKVRSLPEHPYIFLVYGPGGMGKTTLTKRLTWLADKEFKHQFQTVFLDWEREQGLEPRLREGYDNIQPETILDILHKQLEKQLSNYTGKTYSTAREKLREVESKVEKALQSQTPEQGLNNDVLKLGGKGIAWIIRQQTGLNLVKPEDIERVLKVSAEGLHQITRFVDKALDSEERILYQQPHEQLAETLGKEIQKISQRQSLVLFLDTYEIVDRRACDYTLRQVIRTAGNRAIWVISGRSNLAESGRRGDRPFNGYSRDFSGDCLSVNKLNEFSRQEVNDYFNHMVPDKPLDDDQAQAVADFSQGIPFVVDRAAVMYREGKPIEEIVEPVTAELGKTTARDAVIRATCERFLVHCFEQSDEANKQNDLRVIYALAMMRRPYAELLREMVDEANSLENRLEILQERYGFLEVEEIHLDEKLANFLRDYLRQEVRRTDPLVQAINETAIAWLDLKLESTSKGITDTADLYTEESLSELMLDRVHHAFWQGEETFWRYFVPRFIEAWQYSQTWAQRALEVADTFALNNKDGQKRLQWMAAVLNKETRLEATPKLLDDLVRVERRQWLQPEHSLILQFQHGRLYYLQDQNQLALNSYSSLENKLLSDTQQLKQDLAEALYFLSGEFIWPNGATDAVYSEPGEIAIRNSLALHPKPMSSYYYRQAAVLHSAKRYTEAVSSFKQAIQIDPSDAQSYYGLGVTYNAQKRYDDAIASYQKAIEIDPSYATAHNNLGSTYNDQKRYDDAIASYQKAIEIDPSDAMAHNNLGNTYNDQKRYDDAIASYQKAIELDPSYATAHNNLGITYNAQKRYDDAIASYQKAIEIDPSDAKAHYNLGITYKAQKRYDDAIASYQKAIEIDPSDAMAHNNLGITYNDQKRYDDAIASYQKAIELDPSDAKAHNNLGIRTTLRNAMTTRSQVTRKRLR